MAAWRASGQTLSHHDRGQIIMTKQSQSVLHVTGPAIERLAGQLRHQLTMLEDGAAIGGGSRGKTIWATDSRSVTVYWAWSVNEDGNPVIADPLAVFSNLQFCEPGTEATYDGQLIGINRLVHALAWQQKVQDHLARLRISSQSRRKSAKPEGSPARPRAAVAA